MSYEATGTIIKIFPKKEVSATFSTMEFALHIPDGNYSQDVKFQCSNKMIEQIEKHQKGDEIKVTFNLRGKEWVKDNNVNYFNTLDVWKIETVSATNTSAQPQNDVPDFEATSDNDLPF
jgi:hypothetical protein